MEDMNVAFGRALTAIGRKHPDVVVLDADLNTSTKSAFFLEEFPERFVQLGIAEQNMMGVAAGMSIGEGFIPFAVTFAAFASKRPCDQVSISVAYQKANVKIVGTYAGISLGKGGTTHQSVEDIAIMRAIPGMYVADPGWPGEIAEVLEAAVARQGPVYIRLSAGTFPDLENGAFQVPKRFTWGKARWFARGRKDTAATVVATGIMIHRALSAARRLREEGISVAVVHCPGIEPMDIDSMKEIADVGRPVITVENHGVRGGLGDAVSQIIESYRPVPLLRMGVKNSFGQTARETEALFRRHGLTEADIAAEVKRCIAHRKRY